jgi:hypothetical protein
MNRLTTPRAIEKDFLLPEKFTSCFPTVSWRNKISLSSFSLFFDACSRPSIETISFDSELKSDKLSFFLSFTVSPFEERKTRQIVKEINIEVIKIISIYLFKRSNSNLFLSSSKFLSAPSFCWFLLNIRTKSIDKTRKTNGPIHNT